MARQSKQADRVRKKRAAELKAAKELADDATRSANRKRMRMIRALKRDTTTGMTEASSRYKQRLVDLTMIHAT